MRDAERQAGGGAMSCGGLEFDENGIKKPAVSVRVIALGEKEGFTKPIRTDRGQSKGLHEDAISLSPSHCRVFLQLFLICRSARGKNGAHGVSPSSQVHTLSR